MSSWNVQIESTPNPATLKFKFAQNILNESHEFNSAQEAERSPLAAKLFGFPWTSGVFLGQDFVTVTKQDWVDWDVLAEPLSGLIKEHMESGGALLVEWEKAEDESEDDSDLVKQLKRVLKTEIKPVVAMDGGDVAFVGFENGILSLKMMGSCAGCPSKSVTLKDGIETRFRQLFPEVLEVVAV